MLTMADERGGGVGEMLTKGGEGGRTPPFLADIICEQRLKRNIIVNTSDLKIFQKKNVLKKVDFPDVIYNFS